MIDKKLTMLTVAISCAAADIAVGQENPGARAGLEEVVITARKREESLQDVPVAVSILSGANLEKQGLLSVRDLVGRTPGLSISQNSVFGPAKTQSYLVLRGVGATATLEPSVAAFLDGVYQPQLAFDIGFLDLERLEVLRGPQGTLFGRNTQGGALNLVTRKPDGETRGKVRFEVDEHETIKVQGAFEGTLIEDELFFRVNAGSEQTEGYIRNKTLHQPQDNSHGAAVRALLVGTPSETFDYTVAVTYSSKGGRELGVGIAPEDFGTFNVYDNDVRDFVDDYEALSFSFNKDFGFATLTSTTSFTRTDTEVFFDWDGRGDDQDNFQYQRVDDRVLAQEFRLASNEGEKLDWLVGVYYFDSEYNLTRDFGIVDGTNADPSVQIFFSPDNVIDEMTDIERNGGSLFGQFSYQITDAISLALGARYAKETAEARQYGEVSFPNIGVIEPFDGGGEETFSGATFSSALNFHINDDVMIYGNISQGFKAGGYQLYPAAQIATGIPFDNETSTNFELGLKGTFLDNTLRINAAIFRVEIEDQQLGAARQINNVPVEFVDNVGESTNDGVELEINYLPADNWLLTANLGYIDARFDEYIQAFADGTSADRAGDKQSYVPEVTANVSSEYTWALNSGNELKWILDYRYIDDRLNGSNSGIDPLRTVDSYGVWDTKLIYESEQWSAGVFVTNVADKYAATSSWFQFFYFPTFIKPLKPRTVGVNLTYRW